MDTATELDMLVGEYQALLRDARAKASGEIERILTREADWTPAAAAHLVHLAKDYDSFMLRNAYAISLVLGTEDGEIGF